ncbi:basal cell adhesion molecule isoform X1 [Etheostoma spectabile]|uniref:basal cell adhesion molecule isoform X1 n=1 Tax=Etheostoma spectabile TaxID=54343 RepID=UPI0013AFDD20|nr:cell surface glycoprotein MUC18-like isoform X1 [Etheostoma spectabile]
MDGITFGRASLFCTLLLWAFQVCSGAVTVKVTSKVEVLKGDTAKLPCTYTVSPPSSNTVVEWYIEEQGTRKRVAFTQGGQGKSDDGTLLSGRVTIGQDFTLTISSVQPSDELVFYCQVTAGPAGVGDAATMLKVFFAPEKPELTKPSSQAITAGETTSSEIGTCVTSNGHPQPRIIWFKDDQPLPEVKDRKEKTYMIPSVVKESSGLSTVKSTLYMQPTKADKDSVFKCTVEYSMPGDQIKQKMSDTITINLNYPSEKATFSLLNTSPVKEGDTVTMKCETDGNPQPEFDFTKDGKATSGQGSLLILKSVKRTDGGVYKCTATDFDNLEADLSGTITLTVNYIDPVSVSPAQPQVVILGDKVEWQCKTKASAGHTIQWKKGSEVLSQDGTLSLQNVSYDKAGEYMCVGAVPSVPGLTAQASVNLTVKGKPMIDTPAVEEVGKEGDMVTLKCSAYGSPAPQFTWKPSGKESVLLEGNKVVSTVTLQATAAVMKDGATCEVSNQYGTDSKTFVVSLKRAIDNSADRVLLSGNPVLKSADKQQGGSSGVVIAVVVCVLLLLLMVALIYFLNKKSKLPCSKKDKKEVASGEVNSDIVVEMKTDKANEEAGLLNKRPSPEQ